MLDPRLSIFSAPAVRAIDRYAIDELGVPGYDLMRRAGQAACELLCQRWPQARRLLVVCGAGNNGGDGYVVAKLAREASLAVSVVALAEPSILKGDALQAYEDYVRSGGSLLAWSEELAREADVIVDAIFGTGLSRDIDASGGALIEALNRSGRPILALDVPSGIDANTGAVLGRAIHATRTITFVGQKQGLYLGNAPDYVGEIAFSPLGLPPECFRKATPTALLLSESALSMHLLPRPLTAHKGSNGHVLIVGGAAAMGGAVRLAGEASLRVGAGLVTLATHPSNVGMVVAARPELICRGIGAANDLQPLLENADVVAIGPGLGQDEWASALVDAAFASDKPLVVDADALNLLAKHPRQRGDWILTPHPGEAGRLLGSSTADVQKARLESAALLASRYDAIAVLKGAGTIVARAGELPRICPYGNPGMATPGMGDVLTGVIAGLLAQLKQPAIAAELGVLVHALAGDAAAVKGQRGLIASDVFEHLRACVNR